MLARKFKIAQQQVRGVARLNLQLYKSGDVPEDVIQSELLSIVRKYNPAFGSSGETRKDLSQEQIREIHAQGPELYEVEEKYIGGGSRVRIGGMYVPLDKQDVIFNDLQALGYEFE